jgi:hypothetical protein
MASKVEFNIPSSAATVQVHIINTTSRISNPPTNLFFKPNAPGFTTLPRTSYSFLIEHSSDQKLLFDLGVRRDWQNYSPKISNLLEKSGWEVEVKQDVSEPLEDYGVDGKDINAISWIHYHWDRTSNPSTFDSHTSLMVCPGFKENFTPLYPGNPESPPLDTDFAGREGRVGNQLRC